MARKVQFGLRNVHIAEADAINGVVSYGTPKALPGGVNLTLEPTGDAEAFYADDIVYFQTAGGQGYSGTMEVALIPDWFRTDILGDTIDADGVIIENGDATPKTIAILYEVQSDTTPTRRLFYWVSVSRAGITHATKGQTTTPQTETLNISVSPSPENGDIKANTTEKTSQEQYNNWFKSVHVRNPVAEADTRLSALTLGSLTLSPAFDPETMSYTVTTANATNTVSATAADTGATVSIDVNGGSIQNGAAATWNEGANAVTITVSNQGASSIYTVTVTKE